MQSPSVNQKKLPFLACSYTPCTSRCKYTCNWRSRGFPYTQISERCRFVHLPKVMTEEEMRQHVDPVMDGQNRTVNLNQELCAGCLGIATLACHVEAL